MALVKKRTKHLLEENVKKITQKLFQVYHFSQSTMYQQSSISNMNPLFLRILLHSYTTSILSFSHFKNTSY